MLALPSYIETADNSNQLSQMGVCDDKIAENENNERWDALDTGFNGVRRFSDLRGARGFSVLQNIGLSGHFPFRHIF